MPRPRHHAGSGRLPVIPHDWEAAHQPVADGTRTGTCRIWPAESDTTTPVWSDEAGSPILPPADPIYTGTCRVQVVNQRLALKLLGDQAVRHMTYLVTLDRGASIPSGAVVEMTTSTDNLLESGHRLTVSDVMRGTLRFERDLVCIDDLTAPTPGG